MYEIKLLYLTRIFILYELEKHIGMSNNFLLMQSRCGNYSAFLRKKKVFCMVIGLFYGTAGIYVMSNDVPFAVYLFIYLLIYSFILQSVLRQAHSLFNSDLSTKAHLVLLLSVPSNLFLKVT